MLEASKLTLAYGQKLVLDDLDLKLGPGIYVLFGANGSGKTTLAKTLATIIRPDSGSIRYFGKGFKNNKLAVRSRLGFLGHEPFIYHDLTAEENLDFYCQLYRVKNRREAIGRWLRIVELGHRANDRAGTFSRGMMQRLGIARALIHNPEIIILDEPFTGLDLKGRKVLRQQMDSMAGQNKCIFITTHDLELAGSLNARCGILDKGRIVLESDGPDREFLDHARKILEGA